MEFLGTEKCFTWMDDDNSNQPGDHNGRFAIFGKLMQLTFQFDDACDMISFY